MNWLLVLAGGAVGAALRYLIDRAVQRRQSTPFPWGTFTVNTLGSLVLGLLTGAELARAADQEYGEFIGTGLCGALTTYSTFSWETVHLARTGETVRAAGNTVSTTFTGLGAVLIGITAAQALWD
ncbi:fluoride efflux transporter CrcB [Streptomyces sp. NPDC086077]|uniref:fluoride efflux transporter CrcB n=1 Tax=Streptomyces sp. NPDC086077 TaxID=3154862 RepID=UPI00343EA8B2